MTVKDVPAVVKIKRLKGRLIAHKSNTEWAVKSIEKNVASKFAIKYQTESFCWTKKAEQGRLTDKQVLLLLKVAVEKH